MMFWIIAGAVAVLLAVVWWWAGKHSTVRGNLRGYRFDQLGGGSGDDPSRGIGPGGFPPL